jgi:hypothetical protein
MTNHDPIESSLERLPEVVSLRADEKAATRETLLSFMEQGRKSVPSPYAWLFGPGVRVAATLLLVVMIGGGGIASAAEGARPGDALYVVKLKVTEPARTALIFDTEKRTKFKVERADKRLKEFAVVAAADNPDPETTALIAESLSESISEVSEEVATLSATGQADEALTANADLQSLLEAHSEVLDAITGKNPSASEDVATISASVDTGIAATENVERSLVEALEPTLTTDEPVAERAVEAEVSIAELLKQIEAESAAIDVADRENIASRLSEINEIVAEAWALREAGDRKGAYLLYTEANQRLSELKTRVEADRDLGIGISEEETEIPVE